MKIIGHRGAAGLKLENTLPAIRAGVTAKADYIEFDIRATRDGQLVLCHDDTLLRTFQIDRAIHTLTLAELQKLCPEVPTLEQALKACRTEGVIVELKVPVDAKRLLKTLGQFPDLDIRVASFNHTALKAVKKAAPQQFCYLLQHRHWRKALQSIRALQLNGLGLHYAAMNPFLYLIARHRGLQLYVYTLNKPWLIRIYRVMYPQLFICTDNPSLSRSIRQ